MSDTYVIPEELCKELSRFPTTMSSLSAFVARCLFFETQSATSRLTPYPVPYIYGRVKDPLSFCLFISFARTPKYFMVGLVFPNVVEIKIFSAGIRM
jgi:hypothetical protein